MKKKILAAVLAASAVLMTACGSGSAEKKSSADHLQRIKDAGKITIGLEGDWIRCRGIEEYSEAARSKGRYSRGSVGRTFRRNGFRQIRYSRERSGCDAGA